MDTIWLPQIAQGDGPKYKAVAQSIRSAISSGVLPEGEKLPPVRDLAWKLGITPGTVARAYTILTDEGVLTAEVGRGTFVAPQTELADVPYVPLEIDAVPHGTGGQAYRVNLFSPVLQSIGQAELIKSLLREVAEDPPSGVMHYPGRAGAEAARAAALHWMAGCPLGPVDQDDVVLTLGGQHAILTVMQAVLHGRRPTILVEELSYPGFRRAAELLRADVVAVEMDADGLIPEALAAAAKNSDAQLLCTSPEVHNPTVGFTPIARREEIARVAETCGFQILEDDCYRMGAERGPTYRQLAPERGWYVSSIAKTVTPALRVGFAIAPHGKTAALRRTVEHGMFGLPTPMIDLAAKLLSDARLPALTAHAREIYGEYARTVATVLDGYDIRWRDDVPFVWLTLPLGWRAGAFGQAAEAADVPVRSAEEFAGREARAPHAVRLALNAGVQLQDFGAAIARLRHLLDNPPEQIGV
ncbi:PLP-dependent aminotransferase family protein [Sulfitobacter sp. TSTF-M16]|uniref:PLP-dependent aminotransferase family protein n=1 Tax=Sulfitobacter aestuariivivens TaxID=2766981 RepID=A0A927D5E1_9RHOB|nr:PLP-dependent aminotransferase family protein [Sulfitobacter aestuariivivens]MBD3663136.1 PLP-dependent aminotransferase family protein [Sulfitobacter aestuariivivens]